jgi:hypothetical protein
MDTPGSAAVAGPQAATDTSGLTAVAGPPGAATDTSGLTAVAGQPTAGDLAALTAALSAVLARAAADRAAADRSAGRRAGGWADRARLLRPPLAPGPGAWRRSARPH